MKKSLGLMAISILIMSSNVQAQDIRPYVGIGVGGFSMDFGLDSKTAFGGYVQVGADYGDYIGGELRVGGTSNATSNVILPVVGIVNYKFRVDYFISYLGKIRLPINKGLELYALFGGTSMKTRLSVNATSHTSSNTGFSFGGGINYNTGEQLSLGFEWLRYASDANIVLLQLELDKCSV